MAELLKAWLQDDLALQSLEDDKSIEEAFASGYGFGELLNRFNLQPDLRTFSSDSGQDAKIRNFSLVQPVLHSLGVKLSPTTLEQLMAAKEGVAPRIIYEIKVVLDDLENSLKTIQRSSADIAGSGSSPPPPLLAQTFAINAPRGSDRVSAWPPRTVPRAYEFAMEKSFEYNVHRVSANSKQARAEMRTQKFRDLRAAQEAQADRQAAEVEEKEDRRRQHRIQSLRDSLRAKIDQGLDARQREKKVLEATWRRREEWEQEELRFKTAAAQRATLRKQAASRRGERDVIAGIETFEQRIMQQQQQQADGGGDESGAAAAAPPSDELPPDFMDKLKERRAEEDQARKDREMRRRMAIQKQAEVAAEQEAQQRTQALIAALNTRCLQEQELAASLRKARQEKDVVKSNRLLRERELAEIRELEWKKRQLEEIEAVQSIKQNYHAKAAQLELDRKQVIARWAAEEHQETEAHCRRAIEQMITIAEAEIEFMEKTERTFPDEDRRQWSALFLKDLVPQASVPSIIDPQFDETLNRAAMHDYLYLRGEWSGLDLGASAGDGEGDPGKEQVQVCGSRAMGEIVCNAKTVADRPEIEKAPSILNLPFRVCVTGMPYSGKTTIARKAAEASGLKVFSVDDIVKAAIEASASAQDEEEGGGGSKGEQDPKAQGAGGEGKTNASEAVKDGKEDAGAEDDEVKEDSVELRLARLGAAAKAAQDAGECIPDAVLVNLIVLTIVSFQQQSQSRPGSGSGGDNAKGGRKGAGGSAGGKRGKGAQRPPEEVEIKGFILEGFPRTRQQSSLLSQAFSGVDIQFESNQSMLDSPLAPYPPDRLAEITCPAVFDVVVSLAVPDDGAAIRRATGRRVDSRTGEVYHVEFDPPPPPQPEGGKKPAAGGADSKLIELEDDPQAGVDEAECQSRLESARETLTDMEAYWDYFRILRRVDTDAPVAHVLESVQAEIEGARRAKQAMQQAIAAAKAAEVAADAAEKATAATQDAAADVERAARELFLAKKAQLQAMDLFENTPKADTTTTTTTTAAAGSESQPTAGDALAAESLKAEHAQQAAQTLQIAEAAAIKAASFTRSSESARDEAQAQRDQAQECARNAAATPEALELAEQAAAEAARFAQQAQDAAGEALSALESSRALLARAQSVQDKEAGEGGEEEEEQGEGGEGQGDQGEESTKTTTIQDEGEGKSSAITMQDLSRPQGQHVWSAFVDLQAMYESGLQTIVHALRHEKNKFNCHLVDLKTAFAGFLVRPDSKQAMVEAFQSEFNAVDPDERAAEDVKIEWNLRVEELRDRLWDICDERFEQAQARLAAVRADTFVRDHVNIIQTIGGLFSQIELDRLWASLGVVRSFYLCRAQLDPARFPMGPSPRLIERVGEECEAQLSDSNPNAGDANAAIEAPAWLAQAADALPILHDLQLGIVRRIEDQTLGMIDNRDDPNADESDSTSIEAASSLLRTCADFRLAVADLRATCIARLRLVLKYAATFAADMDEVAHATYDRMEGWMSSSLEAECSSVSAFADQAKRAILAGVPLPYAMTLSCATFEIDCGVMRMEPVCVPERAAPLVEPLKGGRLPLSLILDLARAFRTVAPPLLQQQAPPRVAIVQAAELLCQLKGAESCPAELAGAPYATLVEFAGEFDAEGQGLIDWRRLIAALLLENLAGPGYPSARALLDSCRRLIADRADGILSVRDLDRVDLLAGAQQRGGEDGEEEQEQDATPPQFDEARLRNRVLFETFSQSRSPAAAADSSGDREEALDGRAALLCLCADKDVEAGVRKAAEVITDGWQAPISQAQFRQMFDLDASAAPPPLPDGDAVSVDAILQLAQQDGAFAAKMERYRSAKLFARL